MKKYRILVVEDDKNVCEAISTFLDFEGYQYDAVNDGESALAQLSRSKYDLVLCDLNLPDVVGYEILRVVKKLMPDKKLPFIFVSAFAGPKDVEMGLQLGADEYITKPFTNKALIDTIAKWLP